jgi:hypothetical protein
MIPRFNAADEVRQAMLDALGTPTPGLGSTLIVRIRYATDLQQLWDLRCDLMQVLALMRGEAWAGETLGRISTLFGEGLPCAMVRSMGRGQLRA